MKKGDCEKNDVLMTMEAPLGNIAYIPDNRKYILSQRVVLFKTKPNIDKVFFKYSLMSRYFQKELVRNSTGSTATGIQQKKLFKINIVLPKDAEQRAMAAVFETIDEGIEATEKIIAKRRRVKEGLMQDLFSYGLDEKGNLRSEATHRFKDSLLGRIPEDWDVFLVGDLLKKGILSGVQDGNHGEAHPKNCDFVDEGIPFIMASDISQNKIDFINCKKITLQQYKTLRIGFSKPDDVLLSHKASIGFTAIVLRNVPEIMLTPQVTYYRISKKDDLFYKYLFYFFQNKIFQRMLDNLAKQSTRNYIGILAQRKLFIAYPRIIKEQSRIVAVLTAADETIEKEEAVLEKLKSQKRGLMEDLLTGQVRVTNNMIKQYETEGVLNVRAN
jgi:type I restriction enzyme S subunit